MTLGLSFPHLGAVKVLLNGDINKHCVIKNISSIIICLFCACQFTFSKDIPPLSVKLLSGQHPKPFLQMFKYQTKITLNIYFQKQQLFIPLLHIGCFHASFKFKVHFQSDDSFATIEKNGNGEGGCYNVLGPNRYSLLTAVVYVDSKYSTGFRTQNPVEVFYWVLLSML